VLAVAHPITLAAAHSREPLYFLAAAGAAGAAAGAFAALALGALAVFAAGAERGLGAPRGALFGFSAPTAGMPPFGRPVLFLAFLGAAAFFVAAACDVVVVDDVCVVCVKRESVC
jgi:hypothetical protein